MVHVTEADAPPTGDDGAVRLSLPAATSNLRVVRLVAASLATDLDFGVDEIEDVRVAVDELAALLLEALPGDPATATGAPSDERRLEVSIQADEGVLEVLGSCAAPADTAAPEVHEVAGELLSLLVDEYELGVGDGRRWFRLRRAQRVDSEG